MNMHKEISRRVGARTLIQPEKFRHISMWIDFTTARLYLPVAILSTVVASKRSEEY
jgi:hypothetical protein